MLSRYPVYNDTFATTDSCVGSCQPVRERDNFSPQAQILDFRVRLHHMMPKRVTSIFPAHIHSVYLEEHIRHPYPFHIAQSYELAVKHCQAQV